jgi:hypothetical protein
LKQGQIGAIHTLVRMIVMGYVLFEPTGCIGVVAARPADRFDLNAAIISKAQNIPVTAQDNPGHKKQAYRPYQIFTNHHFHDLPIYKRFSRLSIIDLLD